MDFPNTAKEDLLHQEELPENNNSTGSEQASTFYVDLDLEVFEVFDVKVLEVFHVKVFEVFQMAF